MLNWVSGGFLNVINLANSIIGVSILAMPYCFQKCGILLSILLIVVSGTLVRVCCYLLLKCAIMTRRRNFENLAFHAFGFTGKLAVEIGVIGFLIGVCIAFFVVIGDLGPPLASEYMMLENTPNLRAEILVFLGLFVALPLGLLKNVNSLTSLSAFSIAFYGWLVLKIFSESTSQLALNEWWHEVNWWQVKGLLPCLPIFSMALSCQTQLFEFFDTLGEPSLKRMMSAVNGAVFLCSAVYILVGLFGYIACHDKIITGNILVSLSPSVMTECIKLLFVFTVVISFPLCLFPCRTSLHSLLFKQGIAHHEITVNFIPDHRFRFLTISLVIVTIGVSIMIPNIEFALGIIGSTIGTMICLIFPALVFIHDTNKNTTEKRMAQVVMFTGLFILFACTYSTLQEGTQTKPIPKTSVVPLNLVEPGLLFTPSPIPIAKAKEVVEELKGNEEKKAINMEILKSPDSNSVVNEKRQEPPVPLEPENKIAVKAEPKVDLDPQALQKEDKEIQKESVQQAPSPVANSDSQIKDKQEQILKRLEEQQVQQKIILEQQQKVLKELIKHQESHDEKLAEEKKVLVDIPSKDVKKVDDIIVPIGKNINPGDIPPSMLLKVPVLEIPKVPAQEISMVPVQEILKVHAQEIPKIYAQEIPKVYAQEIPKVYAQEIPKVHAQEIPVVPVQEVPRVPFKEIPKIPVQEIPKVPVQEMPRMPDESILKLPIIPVVKQKPESLVLDKERIINPIDNHNFNQKVVQNSSNIVIQPNVMPVDIVPKIVPNLPNPILLIKTGAPPVKPNPSVQQDQPKVNDIKLNVELKLNQNLKPNEIETNSSDIEINKGNVSQKPLDDNDKHEM